MTVVGTDLGKVRGREERGVVSFKGIPYAAPPEGPLRLRPPAPRDPWDGVRDCFAFGVSAPQLAPNPKAPSAWRPGDGLDCLSLNVWTPGGSGLPVLVWIHGGLWKYGSSSMPQYDGATLARGGVVVVTVNYRVGFEGFGQLPGVPGNRGLRDQVAALAWVRRNIAEFGGDPDNVTAFGQSAGASSVAYLSGNGLFRRAITQSIPAGQRSENEAAKVTAEIAAAAGVTVGELATLPPEAILAVQDAPMRAEYPAFGPVLDGDLVTGPPLVSPEVDLLCGFTHEEHRGHNPVPPPPDVDLDVVGTVVGLSGAAAAYRDAYPGRSDAELFRLLLSDALVRIPTTRVAEAHAGRTWLYDFAWASPTVGAGHGVDVPFVFGNGESRFAARMLGSPPPAEFEPLSQQVRRAWAAFATNGDPGWPGYEPPQRHARRWDAEPLDVLDPIAASRRIWEGT